MLFRSPITLIAGITYWYYAKKKFPALHITWGIEKKSFIRIKGFVGFGILQRAANAIFSRLDQVLIGTWVGVSNAGFFSLPVNLMTLVVQMISNMVQFVVPMASELQGLKDIDRLRDIFIRTSRFITTLSTMCFIPLLILGDHFMTLWVGKDVSDVTAKVFRLLLIAGYIGVITNALIVNILIGLGHIKQFSIYLVTRGVITCMFNFLFIPSYGIIGAGIAQLTGNLIDIAFLIISSNYYLKLNMNEVIWTAYMRPVLLGVSIALITIAFRPWTITWLGLITSVFCFEIIYIGLGYLIGVFGKSEIEAVRSIWKRVF